ncbi:MAG: Rnf-Nqr domain containing protein [Spongiibacteraceae bacterium]
MALLRAEPGPSMSSLSQFTSPLLLAAVLLYQCVLVQGLGLCPLSGNTHDPRRVLPIAVALAGTTAAAIFSTALIQQLLLIRYGLDYLQTYVAIICVALSAQIAVLTLQRTRHFIPTNTTAALLTQISVLGVVVVFSSPTASLLQSVQNALIGGGAFALIYVLFAAQRERLLLSEIPAPFRGAAIHVLTAGLVALALMGFAGLV